MARSAQPASHRGQPGSRQPLFVARTPPVFLFKVSLKRIPPLYEMSCTNGFGSKSDTKFVYEMAFRIRNDHFVNEMQHFVYEIRIRTGRQNSLGKHSEFELLGILPCGCSCAQFAYKTYRICSFGDGTEMQRSSKFARKT